MRINHILIKIMVTILFILNCSGNDDNKKDYSVKDTLSVNFNQIKKIIIDNHSGGINIVGDTLADKWECIVTKVVRGENEQDLLELVNYGSIEMIDQPNSIKIKTSVNEDFPKNKEMLFYFEFIIPKETAVEIKNINGEIMTDNLQNQLKINNLTGNIQATHITSDFIDCETVTGNIYISARDITDEIQWSFLATTGNIDLTFIEGVNARLTARVNTGFINWSHIDYFSILEETQGLLKARIKEGKGEIFIETITGNINITSY